MLEIYLSFKNKFQCKPNPKQVHDPKTFRHQKGNIKRSKGYLKNSSRLCPNYERSIDISDPIIHENFHDSSKSQCNSGIKDFDGSFRTRRRSSTSSRLTDFVDDYNEEKSVSSKTRLFVQLDSDDPSMLVCYNCGEKLKNINDVETHYINEHSVTELEENSSRQIVETICESGKTMVVSKSWPIDCILKVNNMPKTIECFEDYRENVKINAKELHNKNHPRCLVDGNEVLMFHGTNIACSLGINSCYSLCTLDNCGVCQILKHGFSTNKEFQGSLGVYTCSTSGKAFDSIMCFDERKFRRKIVIVCRVIAGRVHSDFEEKVDLKFDSLGEKISDYSDIEDLYLLNPKALLPCFVVIYKQQTYNEN